MGKLVIDRGNFTDLTSVSNLFIDEYMPNANGEFVKIYLYLEQLRFGDDLHVECDLQKTDFKVPMLSVQPFVENAINWGVGQKEDGGTVWITTRENEEQIELCVIDDGVGFDISKMEEQSDGRQHIGVRNARIRFQKMCNGTVDIYSEKGKGTKIRINLPKGGQSWTL